MVLLNNDLSSIVVAIEMGRLVFDNLKKVVLYLMPVRVFLSDCVSTAHKIAGRNIYRVHHSVCECVPGNAACIELLPPSLLLHHKRCRHVDFSDV